MFSQTKLKLRPPVASIGLSLCMAVGISLIDHIAIAASFEHDGYHHLKVVAEGRKVASHGHRESHDADLRVVANAMATRPMTATWRNAGMSSDRSVLVPGKPEMISQTNRMHNR